MTCADAAPPVVDAAIVDLLGALAYAQLSGFDRLAEDARLAPTLGRRADMARLAAQQVQHFGRLAQRLADGGVDVGTAMQPFVTAVEAFHALTVPSTWLESVVKAYVGDGLAADFYREVATLVDADTRSLIDDVLAEEPRAAFAVGEVSAAVRAQPAVAGRLALWARRLVGEAVSQAQHVLAERESLLRLLMQGSGDLAAVAALTGRLTARHDDRLRALGLGGS